MSNEKKTRLFRVYSGLYYPVIYRDYNKNCKDPYQSTSLMESKRAFFVSAWAAKDRANFEVYSGL